MVRQSSEPDAPFFACMVLGDGTIKIFYRTGSDKTARKLSHQVRGAEMIQVEKSGDSYTVSAAKFGEPYEQTSVRVAGLKESLLAGFFVCSGTETEKEAAAFSNIRFFE